MTRIVCTLEDGDRSIRQARWLAIATDALFGIEPTTRGLRLSFAAGAAEELGALAELERNCCLFASWTVENDGRIAWLDVAGLDDEAVPAVQAMFGALRSLGTRSAGRLPTA